MKNVFWNAFRAYKRAKILRDSDSIISKAARFVACEMIDGDYYEFGVYQGAAFIRAFTWLDKQFQYRINLDIGGKGSSLSRAQRQEIWAQMKFHAFDSFEGLPNLKADDLYSNDFQQGQWACDLPSFLDRVKRAGVPLSRVRTVKGFFSDTCSIEASKGLQPRKAAIVWLDADLYSSSRDALQFVSLIIQDGTIVIFDDWFSFKGNPRKGVQKAFYEWRQSLEGLYTLTEYQRDSWKRMSFIASLVEEDR